jgi:hypothetical protein
MRARRTGRAGARGPRQPGVAPHDDRLGAVVPTVHEKGRPAPLGRPIAFEGHDRTGRPRGASRHRRAAAAGDLAVDAEPALLAAVAGDLRRGFGERYRILRAGSGAGRSGSWARCAPAASRWRCWSPTSGCPASPGPTTSSRRASSSRRPSVCCSPPTPTPRRRSRRSTTSRSTTTCSSRGTRPRSSLGRLARMDGALPPRTNGAVLSTTATEAVRGSRWPQRAGTAIPSALRRRRSDHLRERRQFSAPLLLLLLCQEIDGWDAVSETGWGVRVGARCGVRGGARQRIASRWVLPSVFLRATN